MISLLLADDHKIVRDGLRLLLEGTPGIRVAAEASSGAHVLKLIRKRIFDIVLLDLTFPDRDGFEVLLAGRKLKPGLPFLFYSMHPEAPYGVRAMAKGAAGYVCKSSSTSDLIEAIRTVVKGRRYMGSRLAESMADAFGPGGKGDQAALSKREAQILRLLAAGKAVSRIAADLNLTPGTISTYRSRVMIKLNLRNNAELIRFTMREGRLGRHHAEKGTSDEQDD